MDGRDRLENHLRENGVVFGVQEHPTAYTAQKIAASEHVPGRMFAKVVMASTDADLIMLVLAASSGRRRQGLRGPRQAGPAGLGGRVRPRLPRLRGRGHAAVREPV